MYESPLIERGAVLLDTLARWELMRAAGQQHFHKSVMLLLGHEAGDDGYTVGVALNRPTAMQVDGWRLWYGGPVGDGGLFRGVNGDDEPTRGDAAEDPHSAENRMITCLHEKPFDAMGSAGAAARLSWAVLPGVYATTLAAAQQLVAQGVATKSDFWTFVGYAGWGPGQLEGEVADGNWALASAGSGTLLRSRLRQGAELAAQTSADGSPSCGLGEWESLMGSIGRAEAVSRSRGGPADQALAAWVKGHLGPPQPREA